MLKTFLYKVGVCTSGGNIHCPINSNNLCPRLIVFFFFNPTNSVFCKLWGDAGRLLHPLVVDSSNAIFALAFQEVVFHLLYFVENVEGVFSYHGRVI